MRRKHQLALSPIVQDASYRFRLRYIGQIKHAYRNQASTYELVHMHALQAAARYSKAVHVESIDYKLSIAFIYTFADPGNFQSHTMPPTQLLKRGLNNA